MKPLTRDAKLTHKQWAALWAIAFTDVKVFRKQYGHKEFLQVILDDGKNIAHLYIKLREKGMVRLQNRCIELTPRGQHYL